MKSVHERLMKRALELAQQGAGQVSPNPLVGCVVACQGRIVGEGYHIFARRQHAEVVALSQAGENARCSDLYVTLEPCSHRGRTPACVDQIIDAGVGRVFFSLIDPDPRVSGAGAARLRQAGIEVREGLGAGPAQQLNEKFLHFSRHGTPFVLLKLALSLDGKIATRQGESQWITGPETGQRNQQLRFEYDAILVGISTVLKDDPSLNVRWRRPNSIHKIVLDSALRTPPSARLFLSGDPVWVFHSPAAATSGLKSTRARLQPVRRTSYGLGWTEILRELGRAGVTSLIVEGGSQVAASALATGSVQKVAFFYGAKIIGSEGLAGVGALDVSALTDAISLRRTQVAVLGNDLLVEAYLPRVDTK